MVFRSSFVRSKMSELAVETDKRCTDLPTLNFSLRPMMNTTLGSQPMTSQLSLRSTLEIWAAQAADAEVPGGAGEDVAVEVVVVAAVEVAVMAVEKLAQDQDQDQEQDLPPQGRHAVVALRR